MAYEQQLRAIVDAQARPPCTCMKACARTAVHQLRDERSLTREPSLRQTASATARCVIPNGKRAVVANEWMRKRAFSCRATTSRHVAVAGTRLHREVFPHGARMYHTKGLRPDSVMMSRLFRFAEEHASVQPRQQRLRDRAPFRMGYGREAPNVGARRGSAEGSGLINELFACSRQARGGKALGATAPVYDAESVSSHAVSSAVAPQLIRYGENQC